MRASASRGTRNLIAAARAAGARRFVVQSIAFAYVPGREPHVEDDPLNLADGPRLITVRGAADMEQQALASVLALARGAPGIYNIADDDGAVSIEKARRELGFDPAFRSPV